ncbi:MAG: hypothetical protein RJQ21_10075, partial [Rhodospirillales bacterium]
ARTDRVAILRRGELVANAPLADLQRSANLPVRIRVRSNAAEVENIHRAFGGERVNGISVEFACPRPDKMARLSAISALGDAIDDVDVYPPSLDEIYRYFLQQTEDEGAVG